MSLTFEKLTKANYDRGVRWHTDGLSSWSLSDWCVALGGEVGEMMNIVKKLNRSRDGIKGNNVKDTQLETELGRELADIQIYLVLVAEAAGVDLEQETINKFNEVSVKHGFPERL